MKLYNIFTTRTSNILRILFTIMAITSVVASSVSADSGSGANTVICSIVQVYNSVVSAIFVIGLMLMILGGALYAGAHIMPGSAKGNMQGYGMGMVLGGIIGIIIAVIAPFLLGVISGQTVNSLSSATNNSAGCTLTGA